VFSLRTAKYVTITGKAILAAAWGSMALLLGSQPCLAENLSVDDVWTDTKLYFTAPIRWDTRDWLYFGGAVAAIGAAHQFDGNVRRHFVTGTGNLDGKDPHSLRDALPAAALAGGTLVFAGLIGDSAGKVEACAMLEAGAFSSITAEVFKYAAGRTRPDESTRVDNWRSGGSSFPSLHTTAAFAIGTVFAESGGEDYRWVRRVLGYGIAGGTAYIRLKDNQHWLSDTVAGAAIGLATARFTLNRREERLHKWDLSVMPAQGGGVMVGFNANLD
jgi:membrane-associated phospholipid phosphatase